MSVSAVVAARGVSEQPGRRAVRVLLLDDEEIVQWGFRLLLGNESWVERCLAAGDAKGALELAHRFEPHVALIDSEALGGDPADFCRALRRLCARTRILLLTQSDVIAPSTVRAAGAAGYVSRGWAVGELLQAIRSASAGRAIQPHPLPGQSSLSARQQEVLQLIADGSTNSEIAVRLYLSRDTVKQHTVALYRKLGARNRTHAVQTARRRGLIAV